VSKKASGNPPNYAKIRGRWLVQTGNVKYIGQGFWIVEDGDKKYVVTEEGCECEEEKPCSHEWAAEYLGKTM
jgi:hypothetical protein